MSWQSITWQTICLLIGINLLMFFGVQKAKSFLDSAKASSGVGATVLSVGLALVRVSAWWLEWLDSRTSDPGTKRFLVIYWLLRGNDFVTASTSWVWRVETKGNPSVAYYVRPRLVLELISEMPVDCRQWAQKRGQLAGAKSVSSTLIF